MDRHPAHEQLFAFHDGELTGQVRQVVEGHLSDCPACRSLLAQWKQTAGAAFPQPAVSVSEMFVERVMRRIEAAAHPPRPVFRLAGLRWLAPAMGLAALLVVAGQGPALHPVSTENLLLSSGDTEDAFDALMEDRT